ncbi:hypothetical protein [Ruegeria sp. A3M17]|uniref:hypothetical protein n=1 Tax=Ruegeria sp. A3M17 TaxID=2267229 RepID=UPI000DE82ADB|nr:hypothetical protein [Ruegeria sp. A3M17]RBW62081.1 hypothetical protein DS906_03110 [Ruegeria sp. A3M17]
MKFSRRNVIALGAGVVGLGLADRVIGIAGHALGVIRDVYGPEIAKDPAALEFARAYEDFVLEKGTQGQVLDMVYWTGLQDVPYVSDKLGRINDSVVDKFATSTNVILATELGKPLEFVALFDPFLNTCQNQLGAQGYSLA